MKSSLLLSSIVSIGITSSALGQTYQDHPVPLPQNPIDNQRTGLGTTRQNASDTSAEASPTPENNTAEHDDTLYRGKTSDSENPMMRDEGALHFKTRPKEKIQEVDSLKSLQTTGKDPKFQSNLLNADIGAMDRISGRAKAAREAADETDPRFKTKQLSLSKSDEPTKAEPSPSQSPTASPATKDSKGAKQ